MQETQDDFLNLMRRVQEGCQEAARELFERYGEIIFRVVRRRLHHPLRTKFDSDDFVQAVWASFFTGEMDKSAFRSPDDLKRYLQDMAANKVTGAHRQQVGTEKRDCTRERSLDDSQAGYRSTAAATDPTPSQVAIAQEEWQRLLDGQPDHYRRILILRRQGHTHEEIAQRVGCDPKTIQRLLRRIHPGLTS